MQFAYDKDNRLSEVSLSMAEGEEAVSVIRYSHDPVGNLTRIQTNGEAVTTAYEYDALNRVTKATNETGGITSYAYDEIGKLQSVTDPAGNKISYTYNEAGELVRETDSEGRTLSYEYNALGQPVRITDALGQETIHTYEKGGRLIKTTYPDGSAVSYTYDDNGNVRTKENSDGYRLTYTYDCMNRVEKVISSNGQEKSYTYDVMGNVTSMTDANGNTTAYEYTPGGKLSAVTDALGNRTQYRYDALDNLILIERMGEGEETERKTEYIRNPLGQVEAVRDAFGKEERYTYDAFGRMKEKTDRDGYTTAFTYEPDGKTKSILYADGKSVEMEYDALRRLICVRDWLGTTKIDRDAKGQIEAVTDHTGKTVSYSYGKMGERTGITYPDGKSVSYRYDEQLRLAEMQIPYGTDETEGKSITYHYDGRGRLSEKHFPDGMKTFWHYGENGELTELIHEDKDGILDRYGYEYDLMGNKTAITKEMRGLEKESGRYEYGYDALSRLATVTKDGEALRSYAYDPFGNRSVMEDHRAGRTTAYAYDALDRLTGRRDTAVGKESIREYLYDNRGNLTEEREDGRLLHGYAYSALNRLERAWDAEGKEALYEYNGLGQRTGRQTSDGREEYLLDLTKPYHNLLGVVKGDDAKDFYWDGNAAAMAERKAGEGGHSVLHYYLQDELGSTVRVSGYDIDGLRDGSGYLTYGYDEFGNDLYGDLEEAGIPNPYSRQGEEQPFGYTGYRYDEISGTYFAQAREYQPQTGRFTAEDVIKGNGAFPETLNRYGYCWGNPIKLVDLNGLDPEMGNYYVYYLNNMDGAKGFGHNAMMLVDAEGNGKAYSYMGVINGKNLLDFFAPELESVVGYAELNPEKVDECLKNGTLKFVKYKTGEFDEYGNLEQAGTTEDNYDRALYKEISEEEYQILENEMQSIRMNKSMYSIYTYNCDTVVVTAISKIDSNFSGYYTGKIGSDLLNGIKIGGKGWAMRNLTPNSAFNSIQESADGWKLVYLGNVELNEMVLKDIQKFPSSKFPSNLEDILSILWEDINIMWEGNVNCTE